MFFSLLDYHVKSNYSFRRKQSINSLKYLEASWEKKYKMVSQMKEAREKSQFIDFLRMSKEKGSKYSQQPEMRRSLHTTPS